MIYEYKTKFFRANDELIDTRLNEYGRKGWRVASVTNETRDVLLRVVFEREVNRHRGDT